MKFPCTDQPSLAEIWLAPEIWDVITKGKPVYRGTPYSNKNEILNISSPAKRTPAHMPKNIQREIDDCFETAFGIRFRQRSLFSTGSFEVARSYASVHGEVRTLRPVAPFCYCWGVRSKDLYFEYMEAQDGESVEEIIRRLHFKTDDIATAIDLGHEIMLVGSEFEARKI